MEREITEREWSLYWTAYNAGWRDGCRAASDAGLRAADRGPSDEELKEVRRLVCTVLVSNGDAGSS